MTTFKNRYVALGKESTYGTAVSATTYGEMDDESFSEEFDMLNRDDMNLFATEKITTGKHSSSGSVNGVYQPDFFIMTLIHGVFGRHTPGGTAGVDDKLEHDVNASVLPSYTIRVGRDDKEIVYPGQVVESISISANVGEYVMFSASLVGCKTETSLGTLATATHTYSGDAAVFVGAYVNFEDQATSSAFSSLVQSIDFEIKTNRDVDNTFTLGHQTYKRAPPMQRLEVTGNVTFHKAVLNADVAVDEPKFEELIAGHLNDGTAANPAISILLEVDSNNKARFDFFSVHYGTPSTNVSGRDTQTMSVPFTALYDVGEGQIALCTFSSEDTKFKGGGAVDLDA